MNPFTLQQKAATWPKVAAPSLEGLSVSIPKPADITDDDIAAHVAMMQVELGSTVDRNPGDKVSAGDEVCIDVLGYAQGKLIPHSAQFGLWVVAGAESNLPELSRALTLGKVGDRLKVEAVLPATFGTAELRGAKAVYVVEVSAARVRTVADFNDPTVLAKLNASTLAEAMANIGKDLVAQRTAMITLQSIECAVDAVAQRAAVKVPANVLSQELWNNWREVIGKRLSDRGLVGAEQAESFDAYKNDPTIVAELERRIRNSIVLNAIVDAHRAEFTSDRLARAMARWVTLFNVPKDEVERIGSLPDDQRKELNRFWAQLAAAEFVLEKSKISWV